MGFPLGPGEGGSGSGQSGTGGTSSTFVNLIRSLEDRIRRIELRSQPARPVQNNSFGGARKFDRSVKYTLSSDMTLTTQDLGCVHAVICVTSSDITLPTASEGAWIHFHNAGPEAFNVLDGTTTVATLTADTSCFIRVGMTTGGVPDWPISAPVVSDAGGTVGSSVINLNVDGQPTINALEGQLARSRDGQLWQQYGPDGASLWEMFRHSDPYETVLWMNELEPWSDNSPAIDGTLRFTSAGALGRAALTGNVTASAGSNSTTIAAGVVTEAMQVLADNTTQDVTSTKHGYAPKSPADVAKYLNGGTTPAWSKPGGAQCPLMITGDWYEMADFYQSMRLLLTSGPALTANRMYLYPILVRQAVTITKMAFQVTTAVAASNARMGFYADSNGVPSGSALVDTGDMSTASTAVVESGTISLALAADTVYWWAVAVSGAVGFNGYNGGGVPLIGASTAGDATLYNCYRMTHTYAALPTIGSLTRVQISAPPRFQVKL